MFFEAGYIPMMIHRVIPFMMVISFLFWVGKILIIRTAKSHVSTNEFVDTSLILKDKLRFRIKKRLNRPEVMDDFIKMSINLTSKDELNEAYKFVIACDRELKESTRKYESN